MKNLVLVLSIGLNLALLGVVFFLNERYGLLAKAERVVLQEARVPGIAALYELNRNYQVRREMFRLDKNESAKVLILGDSLTAQGEWNAMLGEPLVANRGIDGDTSAGVLARVGDDADFRGDAVVIWIGTNDVLQGEVARSVVENIWKAVAELKGRTTDGTDQHENFEPRMARMGTDKGEEESGQRLAGQAGAAFSNPSTNELARDSAYISPTRSASGPAFSPATSYPLPATAPEAQVFVLGIPPMARWWEGAKERNATIREINARLGEGADENGYRFIELESGLADENGFLRGDMTSDGVHLSAKGYVAVIEKMKNGPLRGR
jgi:lysophospholipase L1-like esterase